MSFIAVVLLLVILVFIIRLQNNLSERLDKIEKELRQYRAITVNQPATQTNPVPPPVVTPPSADKQPEFTKQANVPEPVKPIVQSTTATDLQDNPQGPSGFVKVKDPIQTFNKPSSQNFFERHPDLEKFIGENLVSKIGIAILVLAIGYFVKFAIDNNWIGPLGRVAVGIACGAILLAIAHFTRNNYKAFSSVLAGGALAVFYFTIALAYHQFGIFSQTTSFIIMVVITGLAVVLSIFYNRQELAIISLIGGFASPFMVSDGGDDYVALFIYLIVLNLGLLAIAYQRSWRLLNLLAFAFTAILLGGWLLTLDENEVAVTYRNAFIFASIFYVLFFAINLAHNIREQKKFVASDFGILLTNTGLYFTIGLYCLNQIYWEELRGVFCIALAVINLTVSYYLLGKNKVDNNILYLLIAITLTFVSLTAPIQLEGNNITLFWATEAVVLYWLFTKSDIKIIRISSMIIWVCMLISLMMDWNKVYFQNSHTLNIIANRGFITTLCSAIATFVLYRLHTKQDVQHRTQLWNGYLSPPVFLMVSIILLYTAGFYEINHQFSYRYPRIPVYSLYLLGYTLAFILLVTAVFPRMLPIRYQLTTIILLIAGVFLYISSITGTYLVQAQILKQGIYNGHFAMHWVNAVLVGLTIYQLIKTARTLYPTRENYLWLVCMAIVIFFTVEIHLLMNVIYYSRENPLQEIQRVFLKTGWPILWGLCSFAFMYTGMRNKVKTLRIASLTLFAITIIKLFTYDIQNIPVAGKIAAFFSLGVLLLIVSFMYQRLKKILIDNEQKRPL